MINHTSILHFNNSRSQKLPSPYLKKNEKINKQANVNAISTFDVSTIYTVLPYFDLLVRPETIMCMFISLHIMCTLRLTTYTKCL